MQLLLSLFDKQYFCPSQHQGTGYEVAKEKLTVHAFLNISIFHCGFDVSILVFLISISILKIFHFYAP